MRLSARTMVRSSVAVFCVALLASICIHLPIYEALGALAEVMLHQPPKAKSSVVELELAPLTQTPPAETPEQARPAPAPKPEPEPLRPPEPLAAPAPEPERDEPKVKVEVADVVPVPQPKIADNPLAVTQKSDDPDAPAPDQARFIADENRRVLEETVARVRNMHRDDPEPSPSTRTPDAEQKTGEAEQEEVADLRDVEGSDERTPDKVEAEHPPEQPSQPSAGQRELPSVARAERSDATASQESEEARAAGAPETGGEPERLVVQDSAGSFSIRKAPPGLGPGNRGGDEQPGMPASERERRAAARQQQGVNLRVSWSQFESTFGSEELRAQRETYLAQRRSRTQGQDRARMWRKFRAAIENFVPNVQPGEQTALNTAASPFANYLANVHRRIHREFAHRFLGNLPLAGGPFGDRTLNATLEIVINGDGTLHQVGVTQTSGFLPFDYGAFNAVMRAAPYPPPPRKILSGDGRVYVHWGFYRNERQCGTFNARPFILPHPGGTPEPGRNAPLQDRDEPTDQPGPTPEELRDGELGRLGRRDGAAGGG